VNRPWFQPFLAEAIGTFGLIFFGAGSIIMNEYTGGGVGLVGIALAHGVVLAVVITATAHISGGHINPAVTIGVWIGRKIEAILTFFLVFTVFGTAVDPRATKLGGWAIGLVLVFAVLAGGPLTGAALNPARAFGPALVGGYWTGHIVYWAGPILGGIVAAAIYSRLLMPRTDETEAATAGE
jgi:glycerol uptake facilitator-like aquaporin